MKSSTLYFTRLLPVFASAVFTISICHAAGDIAELAVSSHQLTWTPQSSSDRLSLTVAGETMHREQRFAAGEQPVLDTLAVDGVRLPDGVYTWELRVISDITLTAADKAAGLVGAWPAETQSGQFVIREGQLFASTDKEE